jgi:hypothetical protein
VFMRASGHSCPLCRGGSPPPRNVGEGRRPAPGGRARVQAPFTARPPGCCAHVHAPARRACACTSARSLPAGPTYSRNVGPAGSTRWDGCTRRAAGRAAAGLAPALPGRLSTHPLPARQLGARTRWAAGRARARLPVPARPAATGTEARI